MNSAFFMVPRPMLPCRWTSGRRRCGRPAAKMGELLGYPLRILVGLHGISWDFNGISMGFQWDFMGFHGISMGFHGISMGFHGILDALFGTTWGISATKWWFKQQLTWDIMNKNGYPIVFSKLVKIPSWYCGLW